MELHDDDMPVGRVLSRREVLALLGGAGAAIIAGTGFGARLGLAQGTGTAVPTLTTTGTPMPTCVVRPALMAGPYFVDAMLNRSDIRTELTTGEVKAGALLKLIYKVSDVSANTCAPLAGAQVDVWHCDALGAYSGVQDRRFDTRGETWLRGYQLTDESGTAEFLTIYPGWYSGRAVHIHFKIRTEPDAAQGYEFTSQVFFDEAMTAKVYAQPPYASKGAADVPNENDFIFQGADGLLTLDVVETDEGYEATFTIGLDLSESASSDAGGQGGRPSGRSTPAPGANG